MPEKSPPTGAVNLNVVLCPLAVLLLIVAASAQVPRTILSQPPVTDRPYPRAYYNQRLPNAGSGGPTNRLMPFSAAIVNTVMSGGANTGAGAWNTPGTDDHQHRPLYFGQSSDPVYRVSGCTGAGAYVNGMKFHAPPGAQYNQSDSDEEIVIWDQTTNMLFQFYNWGGQLTLPACSGTSDNPCTYNAPSQYCSAVHRTTGSGVGAGTGGSTAGLAPMGNIIRLTEIIDAGRINHGLRLITACNDTANGTYPSMTVFPATQSGGTPAQTCAKAGVSSANRPPNGALFFLDYTNAQLDCFNPKKAACPGINKLASWQFMLIEAMTYYGGTIEDTGPGSGLSTPGIESEQSYYFYENHGHPGARAIADSFTNFMNASCSAPSCSRITRSAPHSLVQWSINTWAGISSVNGKGIAGHMHVADPCVAIGLQGMPGGCATASAEPQAVPPAPTGLTVTIQ